MYFMVSGTEARSPCFSRCTTHVEHWGAVNEGYMSLAKVNFFPLDVAFHAGPSVRASHDLIFTVDAETREVRPGVLE